MKAIRVHQFGAPDVMRLEEVPTPSPGEGQVLVRIKAAGVNPVDTYVRSGNYVRLPALPYTPCGDAAGVVETVGPGVQGVSRGERVYLTGTVDGWAQGAAAEFALCAPAQLRPLPAATSFAQGAAVNVPYATAYFALFCRAHAEPGETLLVHGASGGVGIAGVQLARARGLTVIGTAGTDRGRALVLEQGAHHALDHGAADYMKRLIDLTGGRGVDVVLEMLANVNLARDLEAVARGGRIAVIGNRGSIEINPRAAMQRDAAILGISLGNASEREAAGIHAALGAGLANGTLRPVVGQELPLADAPRAHEAVLRPGAYGKIVLVP